MARAERAHRHAGRTCRPSNCWAGTWILAATFWAVGILLYTLLTGAHPLDPFSVARLADIVEARSPHAARERAAFRRGRARRPCRSVPEEAQASSASARPRSCSPSWRRCCPVERRSSWATTRAVRGAVRVPGGGRARASSAAIARSAAMTTRLRYQPLLRSSRAPRGGQVVVRARGVIPALKRGGGALWRAFIAAGRGASPLSALADVLAAGGRGRGAAASAGSGRAGARAPRPRARCVATLRTQPGDSWAPGCARAAAEEDQGTASCSSSISSRSSIRSAPPSRSGRRSWPAWKARPTTRRRPCACCSPSARTSSIAWPMTTDFMTDVTRGLSVCCRRWGATACAKP